MQIWIYFFAGVGGDGFANLLEHASNVEPVDSDIANRRWRVHRWVDGSPKFWAPSIDATRAFRNYNPFLFKNNYLQRNYCRLIHSGTNTICTTHDVYQNDIKRSDAQEILLKGHIKVLLTHNNYVQANHIANIKNLIQKSDGIDPVQFPIDYDQFDYVLSIHDIQKDWSVVDQFCKDVGLKLDYSKYQIYQQILAGSEEHVSTEIRSRPKKYKTSTVDGITTYTEYK